MKRHIQAHTDKSLTCRICGKVCVRRFLLKIHIQVCHGGQSKKRHGVARCSKCMSSFMCRQSYQYHMQLHKKNLPFAKFCTKCGGTNGNNHQTICMGQTLIGKEKNMYTCVKCRVNFMNASLLRQHIMFIHTKKKRYQCICGFNCLHRPMFQVHKIKCNYSFKNLFKIYVPQKDVLQTAVETKATGGLPFTSSALIRGNFNAESIAVNEGTEFYATGLHVLADVSQHQANKAISTVEKPNVSELIMDLSSSARHTAETGTLDNVPTTAFGHPNVMEVNRAPNQQHSILPSISSLARMSGVERCGTTLDRTVHEGRDIGLDEFHGTNVHIQEQQKAVVDEHGLQSNIEYRKLEGDMYESPRKDRVRRNSGQGLERAISALRCKAISEMNRRKTADDVIFIKSEIVEAEPVRKERSSVDCGTILQRDVVPSSKSSSNPHTETAQTNMESYQSAFGTAVIDLSKVNLAQMEPSCTHSAMSTRKVMATSSTIDMPQNKQNSNQNLECSVPSGVVEIKSSGQKENIDSQIPKQIERPRADDKRSSSNCVSDKKSYQESGSSYRLTSIRVVSDTFVCPSCCATLPTATKLINHMNSTCSYVLNILLSDTDEKTRDLLCNICNLNFKNHKTAFMHHLKSAHGIYLIGTTMERKVLSCKLCGQKFNNDAYLREHINGKHNDGTRYSCTCGKTFKWRSSFSGHKRKCNGIITSNVNNRGKGKPLSNARKNFLVEEADKISLFSDTFNLPFQEKRNENLPPQQMQRNGGTGTINAVPGIETLLANVRKDRISSASQEMLPDPHRYRSTISTSKPQTVATQRASNSLRISPKVKSFMEPIVQKATRGNFSKANEHRVSHPATVKTENNGFVGSCGQQQQQAQQKAQQFQQATHQNKREHHEQVDYPMLSSKAVPSTRQINLTDKRLVKQEHKEHAPQVSTHGNTFPQKLTHPHAKHVPAQTDRGSIMKSAEKSKENERPMATSQDMYQVGGLLGNMSPYMLYPNMFNIYPTNFQQIQSQINKLHANSLQAGGTQNIDFGTQGKMFANPLIAGSNLTPFFADAMNAIQNTLMPGTQTSHAVPSDQSSKQTAKSETVSTPSSSTVTKSTQQQSTHRSVYSCEKCKSNFLTNVDYASHVMVCKGGALYCELCKLTFKCKASAREHMLGKHGEGNRYACPCGLRFKWRSSLGCHQRNCSKAPPKRSKSLQ